MTGKLQAEIKQKKPFGSLEEEVYLNLLRTADALQRGMEELLKPTGLSRTQYNVLRILRGAGASGQACGEIAERMLTRDPDITRLLDRLEGRGLIARSRDRKDRRVIHTRITKEGLRLLQGLDEPVAELHLRQLEHLGPRRLHSLLELLEGARAKAC